MMSVQNVNSIQGKTKTIDFTGVVQDLHKPREKRMSKEIPSKINYVPNILSVFQPIYHLTNSNQTCLVSDVTNENLNVCFSNNDYQVTNDSTDLSQPEWYDEVDINSIGLVKNYEPLSANRKVYNEVEIFDIPDEATVQHDNFEPLFKLEDP